MSLCQQRCDLALGSLIMMCLVRVVGPCRGYIEYLGKHTTKYSCAFSKWGDENWPFQKTNTQKHIKNKKNKKEYRTRSRKKHSHGNNSNKEIIKTTKTKWMLFCSNDLKKSSSDNNLYGCHGSRLVILVYIWFLFYTVCPKRSSW